MNPFTNCTNVFTGTYCNQCGQKINSGRIYFKELIHDFFGSFFHLDSRPFLTIKSLTAKPGDLIREFIAGKRKKYYKPVPYFIITIAFYLLVRTLLHFNPIENQYRAMGKEIPSPEVMKSIPMQASYQLVKNINLLLFVFVFIFSALTRLLFKKSNFNYVEHIVFSFYSIGHYVFFINIYYPINIYRPTIILLCLFSAYWLSHF